MQGQIETVPLDDDEVGLRIVVRATGAHGRQRLGSGRLSSGQRAKAALVLLLSCMTVEDSADLLISDEPGAHLDARNLRDVGEAMARSSDHVQVILAAPADAEARRMDWSGHVLLFATSERGEPEHPYVKIAVLEREHR
jgi:ATP-binding cassette subfamily C protein CydD